MRKRARVKPPNSIYGIKVPSCYGAQIRAHTHKGNPNEVLMVVSILIKWLAT